MQVTSNIFDLLFHPSSLFKYKLVERSQGSLLQYLTESVRSNIGLEANRPIINNILSQQYEDQWHIIRYEIPWNLCDKTRVEAITFPIKLILLLQKSGFFVFSIKLKGTYKTTRNFCQLRNSCKKLEFETNNYYPLYYHLYQVQPHILLCIYSVLYVAQLRISPNCSCIPNPHLQYYITLLQKTSMHSHRFIGIINYPYLQYTTQFLQENAATGQKLC